MPGQHHHHTVEVGAPLQHAVQPGRGSRQQGLQHCICILFYSDFSYKTLQLRFSGPFLLFPLSTPTFSGSLSANYEVSWNEAPSMIECKISTTDFLHNRLHNHPGSRALVASPLSHGPGDHTAIVTSSPSFTTVQLGCNITVLTLHDLRCSSEISACILL